MILFDYDKAADLMERWGVDILLPHTLLNAGYLSDHWKHELYTSLGTHTTFDTGEAYQLFVGLPRDRKMEPFITCRRGAEEGDMYNWDVWIKDRRIWGPDVVPRALNTPLGPAVADMYANPCEAVADALRERGLDKSTIGVEMRFLWVEAFEKLQRLLPEAKFRDVIDLFLELRQVKSEEEIRRMRIVSQATQEAYKSAMKSFRIGMSGLDFERLMGAEHYRRGVRHEWLHTMIGPLGVDVVGPNPGRAKPGEIICFDAGASYRHYQSDLCLLVSIGEPSRELLKIHNGMRRAMDAVLEALRPGVPAPEVYRIGKTVYEQEGLQPYFEYVAHGIGRDVHEEPLLGPDSKCVLAKGMTFSVELSTRVLEWGAIGLENNVVITADGREDLSTIGAELQVLAA